MLEHVSYDIIRELCELARNMNWPDGLVLIWLWHGCGSTKGFLCWARRRAVALYFCKRKFQVRGASTFDFFWFMN